MKRFLIAGIAAAVVFATVFGIAASLGVTSGSLGVGVSTVGSCDPDGVTTTYTVAWVIGAFRVTGVTVGDIDGCDGHKVQIALLGTDGTLATSTSAKTVSGDTDASVTFSYSDSDLSARPRASAVTGVQVTIYKE